MTIKIPDDSASLTQNIEQCLRELFPLHRSNTGQGVRHSLRLLQRIFPIELHEVKTGTPVFDWTIPKEWVIRDAFIADSTGHRIVDYHVSNLQVVANSQPVSGKFKLTELEPHLVRLNEDDADPDWIPYRTLFFRQGWGFCVNQHQYQRLKSNPNESFEVVIDSEFLDGSLTYGEAIFAGQSSETILVYAHCCHPSLANDNLSGMIVAAFLGQHLWQRQLVGKLKKSYRIVMAPATIGAIAWLQLNQHDLKNIVGGLVLSLLGDNGSFNYKHSRQGDALIDRAVHLAVAESSLNCQFHDYSPFGYDERQFGSPGINLPVGCLMRTPAGQFKEYHTSGDNLDFISSESLVEALNLVTTIVEMVEWNDRPINQKPFGEPQLGQRGLYRAFGERDDRGRLQEAVLWLLNLADGEHDLLEIATRSQVPFDELKKAVELLQQHDLLT